MKPLVTSIIPAFNREEYIAEAIESVLNQTYRNIEIIVIDDGSTDNTSRILSSYNGKIKYFRQPNSGASAARNSGISKAAGDFISFLDSDDLWEKNKISLQMECFENNPGIDICLCNTKIFSEKKITNFDQKYIIATPYHLCSILIKKEVLKRVGYFKTNLKSGEDTDFFLRIKEMGIPLKILQDKLVNIRIHANNLTKDFKVRDREAVFSGIKNALDKRRNK
jgi:glycosyltransferase involved in cell wall biosynthesis